jgi:hypothetical protein
MPAYLPIRAFNRSQNLRIGGFKIGPNTTSYIDLGQLPIPIGVQTPVETTTGGTGLGSATAYYYVITAVDGNGGETPASAEVTATTSADTTSYLTLRWLPIVDENGNFTEPVGGYNIYRGTASGAETFLVNVTGGTIYADGLATQTAGWGTTVSTVNPTDQPAATSAGVAVPDTTPNVVNNTYTPSENNRNLRKELSQSSAIGAYYVVGGISKSNYDLVFNTLPTLSLSTLTITPSGGEIKNRSIGQYTLLLTTTTVLATKPASGSERFDVVAALPSGLVINLTGPVTTTVGTAVLPVINPANTGVITQTPVTTVSGSNVLSVANTTGIQVGSVVTATGLAAVSGSYFYVTAVTPAYANQAGSVTLWGPGSGQATASATVTATFTNVAPLAIYLVNNTAATSFAAPVVFAPRP